MNLSLFQITRLLIETSLTESYKDNSLISNRWQIQGFPEFQQSAWGVIQAIVLGCAEKYETAHVKTQKEKKAAILPG